MKLVIKRDQDKGFFGGMSFVLSMRVQLTPEEQGLIQKYKVQKEVLAANPDNGVITIGTLVDGISQKCKDVTVLLHSEETIKSACKTFKTYLDVMKSFGGEEVIDIDGL